MVHIYTSVPHPLSCLSASFRAVLRSAKSLLLPETSRNSFLNLYLSRCYKVIANQMGFQLLLSSLMVIAAMSLSIHEVQGIRYKETVSTISINAHQTALHEEKALKGAQTSERTVNYEGAILEEEEMMMVVRNRRRTMSIKVTSSSSKKKKPQNQQHHHWMPSIHEDYYGPRHHKPTHH